MRTAKSPIVQDTLRRAREWRCARHRAVSCDCFDEVWNGRRLDVVRDLYSPDVVVDYRPYAALGHGPDSIRESVERAPRHLSRLPRGAAARGRRRLAGRGAPRITGTQLGQWGRVAPTGKHLEFEEMLILEFDDQARVVHRAWHRRQPHRAPSGRRHPDTAAMKRRARRGCRGRQADRRSRSLPRLRSRRGGRASAGAGRARPNDTSVSPVIDEAVALVRPIRWPSCSGEVTFASGNSSSAATTAPRRGARGRAPPRCTAW